MMRGLIELAKTAEDARASLPVAAATSASTYSSWINYLSKLSP